MKSLSNILFPVAVATAMAFFASTPSREAPEQTIFFEQYCDTVIYPADAYKLRRVGTMPDEKLADSILRKAGIKVNIPDFENQEDTTAKIDTLSPEYLEKKRKDSLEKAQLAYNDSILAAKEKAKAERDSIRENKPRILETFALPDSMQYKRIIHWTVDPDFHDLKIEVPDTGYNYHFNDYPFLKNDVNATWLGMAGSPVQTYDYFKRNLKDEGVEFYRAQESWAYTPWTFKQYNTKTPHTELGYFGTLLAGSEKESDNLHVLTTQNILPELNLTLSFDRYGGEGILKNEKTGNKNFGVGINYLGKKYMANAGYLYNTIGRGENGGVVNLADIRDTTVDVREVNVRLQKAKSDISKNTFFIDQQLRIPFNFIYKLRAKKDSTYVAPDTDNLADGSITTAFVGHSSELSTYVREFIDGTTQDSLRALKLDNRVFIRLQPWSDDGIVSKLDVGIGDRYMNYSYGPKTDIKKYNENSVFLYAGAKGQFDKYFNWNAKAHFNILGARAGDLDVDVNARLSIYPFRKARTSPMSFWANFNQTLRQPTFFQENFHSTDSTWTRDFTKTSQTTIRGGIDIPHWKLHADVNYALLAGGVYYDANSAIRQNANAISILTANLSKEFVFWDLLHLDNRILFQTSSDPVALPLPLVAMNLRYFVEFTVNRDEQRRDIMRMQIGINGKYNTPWYAPGWNPVTGTFYNQQETKYTNGPILDAFINLQWKKACIFVKFENLGMGWPLKKNKDYFAADRYIVTQRGIKLGIFWPFYLSPNQNKRVSFQESVSKANLNE